MAEKNEESQIVAFQKPINRNTKCKHMVFNVYSRKLSVHGKGPFVKINGCVSHY